MSAIKRRLVSGWLLSLIATVAAAAEPGSRVTLRADDGSTLEVEYGELEVPESRDRAVTRQLTLPYYHVRSSARQPATPIFLLADGPGASLLDRMQHAENLQEVAFYRSIADVVVFDQRGGGRSQPAMHCAQSDRMPADQALDHHDWRRRMRALLTACRDQWLQSGVDLGAYNTEENATDVDALRQALGYRRITVIGGSYGAHLALHLMRRYPQAIERAVLYGVEGSDHTWDNPAGRLAALQRIAADAERSAAFPDMPADGLLALLSRQIAALEQSPRRVRIEGPDGPREVIVDATALRRIAAHQAGRRSAPRAWPEMILALARGDFSLPARGALALRELRLQDPMHYSMDCASGISEPRRERYRDDPATALLGDINAEYAQLCEIWPAADLGDGFRAAVTAATPTLIVHGDWDLSTPIENAQEVAATLPNAQLVRVVGGSHGALYNLYAHWPPMHAQMRAFLSGRKTAFPASIALPAPDYAPEPSTPHASTAPSRSNP